MGRRGKLQIFHGEGKVRGEPLYCAGPLLCRLSPFCAPSSQSGSHWNHSGDVGKPARQDGLLPQLRGWVSFASARFCCFRCRSWEPACGGSR